MDIQYNIIIIEHQSPKQSLSPSLCHRVESADPVNKNQCFDEWPNTNLRKYNFYILIYDFELIKFNGFIPGKKLENLK